MNRFRKAKAWLLDTLRMFYPFLVCWIGGLFLAAGWADERKGAALIVTVLAGSSFMWAMDLAYSRGKAKGESETAAKIAALLTTGVDTNISVDINHRDLKECGMDFSVKGGIQ